MIVYEKKRPQYWGLVVFQCAALCAWTLLGVACDDEDKNGCQNDGDCRGVRVCVSGACQTPDGFEDIDVVPNTQEPNTQEPSSPGEPEPDVIVQCTGGTDPFGFSMANFNQEGEVSVKFSGVEQEDGNTFVHFLEGPEGPVELVLESLQLDGPNMPIFLAATPGDELLVTFEAESGFDFKRRLTVRDRAGELLLAACDGSDLSFCQGPTWNFSRNALLEACAPIALECHSPKYVALDLMTEAAETVVLYPGATEDVQAIEGDGSYFFTVQQAYESDDVVCPDFPAQRYNALVWRQGSL